MKWRKRRILKVKVSFRVHWIKFYETIGLTTTDRIQKWGRWGFVISITTIISSTTTTARAGGEQQQQDKHELPLVGNNRHQQFLARAMTANCNKSRYNFLFPLPLWMCVSVNSEFSPVIPPLPLKSAEREYRNERPISLPLSSAQCKDNSSVHFLLLLPIVVRRFWCWLCSWLRVCWKSWLAWDM